MKVYIGNKTLCLGEREDKDGQEGYKVRYHDDSDTWLAKEIFEFEFRKLNEDEIDLVLSTVIAEELSAEDVMEMMDLDTLDDKEFNLEPEPTTAVDPNYQIEESTTNG